LLHFVIYRNSLASQVFCTGSKQQSPTRTVNWNFESSQFYDGEVMHCTP